MSVSTINSWFKITENGLVDLMFISSICLINCWDALVNRALKFVGDQNDCQQRLFPDAKSPNSHFPGACGDEILLTELGVRACVQLTLGCRSCLVLVPQPTQWGALPSWDCGEPRLCRKVKISSSLWLTHLELGRPKRAQDQVCGLRSFSTWLAWKLANIRKEVLWRESEGLILLPGLGFSAFFSLWSLSFSSVLLPLPSISWESIGTHQGLQHVALYWEQQGLEGATEMHSCSPGHECPCLILDQEF